MQKSLIRKQLKEKRNKLSNELIIKNSKIACINVLNFLKDKKPKSIGLFYPIRNEINPLLLTDLLNDVYFYLPKVENKYMNFHEFSKDSILLKSNYGISEPFNNTINNSLDYYIIPGLAFNIKGERIGYGGGFYDKFFDLNQRSVLIGFCFDFQIIENIKSENHDIKLDYIISEKRVVKCNV